MCRVPAPKTWVELSKYMGNREVNISASIRTPCTKISEVPEKHRYISRSLGRCWHTFEQGASSQKSVLSRPNTWGSREVNFSASIMAPCTKCFWRFLRYIWTFLDHLGGVVTFMGGAPVPILGWVEQIHGGRERSISQLLLGPHASIFWRFLGHIGTYLHNVGVLTHLWAECQHSKPGMSWANTWGRGEVNISYSI